MDFSYENYRRIVENNSIFRYEQNRIDEGDFAKIEEIAKYLYYGIRKTQSVSSNNSSYGLKHFFEHDLDYITNAQFILGAIVAGFNHKSYGGGNCNPHFNMRASDVKYLHEQNKRKKTAVVLPRGWNDPNYIRIT